jgi:hypothetical protein
LALGKLAPRIGIRLRFIQLDAEVDQVWAKREKGGDGVTNIQQVGELLPREGNLSLPRGY